MEHRDAEISNVTIVVRPGWAGRIDEVVASLRAMGVEVVEVNRDVGVIEATVEDAKVPALQKLEGVEAVRRVFTYVADYPAGDPRDQDQDQAADEAGYDEEER